MDLKFDHIIHYIDQLEQFKFPGEVVKLNSGGNIINLEHLINCPI